MLVLELQSGKVAVSDVKFVSNVDEAADDPAIITVNGEENKSHILNKVMWSYNGAPTGGRLLITGGDDPIELDITNGGPGTLTFEYPCNEGEDLIVTLDAGGASVVGKVVISYISRMYVKN